MSGFFDGRFGSNACTALLFFDLLRHGIQVAKTLLLGSAEVSFRKEESKSLRAHAEQYFESIRWEEWSKRSGGVRGVRVETRHHVTARWSLANQNG